MPESTPLAPVPRSRLVYAGLVLVTVAAGLASRRFAAALPFETAIRLYAGDVLWAAMVYFLAATIWSGASIARLTIGSIAFSVVVESSQLSRAASLEALRATRLGALVLGFGFLWSDLACYAAGVAIAALVDSLMVRRSRARSLRQERRSDIVS